MAMGETRKLKEAEHRTGMELPSARAGALSLKERLPSLFAKLIHSNIPPLKAAAGANITEALGQRRRLGDAPLNPTQMIGEVQRVLQ